MKRVTSVVVAILLLLVPVTALGLGSGRPFAPQGRAIMGNTLLSEMEAYVTSNIPLRERLSELNLSIRSLGGQRVYNQIFISGDELIPDVDPPVELRVQENTAAILRFADMVGIRTYLMILPTVSAIRQESLPQFSQTQIFNQKQFIEDVYAEVKERVTVADTYQVLFNARDQYLYYRTEDNLTSLGGYYVYSVLGPRLLEGVNRPSLSDYDIQYVKDDFYGNLYTRSPFKDARADTIALFRYVRNPREYLVTKNRSGAMSTYHTLYPAHMLELDRDLDIYLGGLSSVTTITSTAPYRANLLVFGDKTALSWIPFVANHYRTVTLVDLFQLDAQGYRDLNLDNYTQVVFAYGIETYMHYNVPSRVNQLTENYLSPSPYLPEIELEEESLPLTALPEKPSAAEVPQPEEASQTEGEPEV